ncbi:TetR/AcrR family transcriptional regulator [Brachybacterium sacelli]|uniref:AcrR family transcriptional regulator n=1 Tax=Brachybacterium sacelli TaxID=173364 RepID=A0ABS4WWV7_9MICO|nr:TetR/AcrR family transcriptional regulator [Brachybacterium sacelli]MBP2380699.1 AcrR family transcriptional regulator [Brachybacterium sacelli]
MSRTDTPRTPGLRERKREQLHATIEQAALDLMTRHGYQDVTVEMICETAQVSRRTFFNYFGSKEAVVIGHDPGPIPEDVQEAFVHGPRGSILADLAHMLLAALEERPRHISPETWRARLELIRSDPTLAKALADQVAAKNDDLEALVSRRIRTRYAASGMTPGTAETAEVLIARQTGFIVAMWWGIARYAIQTSVENPETSTEELIESLLDTFTLIQEAEL